MALRFGRNGEAAVFFCSHFSTIIQTPHWLNLNLFESLTLGYYSESHG